MIGVDESARGCESAVDRVGTRVGSDSVTDLETLRLTGSNDGTPLLCALRSPLKRDRVDPDLPRVGGEDDALRVGRRGGLFASDEGGREGGFGTREGRDERGRGVGRRGGGGEGREGRDGSEYRGEGGRGGRRERKGLELNVVGRGEVGEND